MDYPSNSQKVRTETSRVVRSETQTEKPDKPEVKKVVTGPVVTRKKPLGKRFIEHFLGGDARGVWGYVVMDILIPAAQDMIVDGITEGAERMVRGEVRSSTRRGYRSGTGFGGGIGHHAYNRYSESRSSVHRRDPRDERPGMSRRARVMHDFDEIILGTRVEAEEIIDRMYDIISKYEMVAVRDLYEMVELPVAYTDEKYGWTDLNGARVTRVRNGYLLDLPRPEPLD